MRLYIDALNEWGANNIKTCAFFKHTESKCKIDYIYKETNEFKPLPWEKYDTFNRPNFNRKTLPNTRS